MLDEETRGGGGGGGGEEEDEENRDVSDENQTTDRERGLKVGPPMCEQGQNEASDRRNVDVEAVFYRSQNEAMLSVCHIPREGPVGGEWDPSDDHESGDKSNRALKGMTVKDFEALLALRDHSCVLSSALQILTAPTKNGHSSPPTSAFTSPTDMNANGKAQRIFLSEALELLQAMLSAFISRLETLLTLEQACKTSAQKDGLVNHHAPSIKVPQPEGAVDRCTKDVKQRAKETRETPAGQQDLVSSCRDPKMQLSLQILWILHQWCQVNRPDTEGKEEKSDMSVLRGLLRDLGEELQDEQIQFDSEARAAPGETAERAVSAVLHDGRSSGAGSSTGSRVRRQCSPHGAKRSKNWCYVSQEAAQLDREDPVKTWDHLIMPLSFPDLNFEQLSMERSHTAPEKSVFRIYYSPPSARRVQLAQQRQSPVSDSGSASTPSPWCTPPTSFSQLCLGSSANLSDDMKEMTAGWRQTGLSVSQEKRGRPAERWADVACSETQTLTKPQMVSVGQQTEGTQSSRNSPARVLSPSLASARSHHISSSLDGIAGRAERPRSSTSSPKLYRRHSASAVSSIPSPTNLSASSSSSTSRDRALWNLSHKSHSGLVLHRQSSPRGGAAQNHGSLSGSKPPGKPTGANRYGLVTEFLRRVSGRADKPAPPGSGQKTKSLKNLERVPTRPPTAPLHRNDSVTRIVNQRFMKQRDEAGRGQREEKGSGLNQSGRHSMSTTTTEQEGNYECSSSRTLTFCFARPSRSTQRQTSNPSKPQRHRHPPAVSAAADSSCG
ncbi:protein SOGA1-like [Salarias fasciatus]|uniref:protein SOGA1-like n=1 Tax=Salarias fasciatus TaxID=181472 RepID=UPI001176C7F6|nr:protein SOGA1-like [Salarias fasciatus]